MPLGSQPAPLREPVCFGCSHRTVAGTLSAGTEGFSTARDVTIEPAGVLHANSPHPHPPQLGGGGGEDQSQEQ